ncbi:MAG: cupin domain-containing protein [Bryobacterales bacterium]|nr:cupin domain-containing protein [Acidobacteriota bacterium]MCB9384149.1 cupin domain-containing protein [Bryobacterales bacterium]
MGRRRLLIAATAAGAALLLVWPGGRERAALLAGKLGGSVSQPWSEVLVGLAPWSMRSRVRAWLGPDAKAWVVALNDVQPTGRREVLFEGPTPATLLLNVHLSVLPAGTMPHPPHFHDEEELLIPLVGEADIVRGAAFDAPDLETERVAPGDVVYHSARLPHTIRAGEAAPARYLVLRWLGRGGPGGGAGLGRTLDLRPDWAALEADPTEKKRVAMDEPTASLARLHVHTTLLGPGASTPEHVDEHDTVLLLLEGHIEMIGQTVTAPSVVFNPAYQPHSFRNAGDQPARYVVVELDSGA